MVQFFFKSKRAKQLLTASLLFFHPLNFADMQSCEVKVAYKFGSRTLQVALVKVSEPLDWSAFLLWLLLEAMKIYQF